MLFFMNDYGQACHPRILEALAKECQNSYDGYGTDPKCEEAANTIRELIGKPDAHVHFMVGGTPTNVVTIAHLLKPYEGVIAAKTGHIYRHETGAVEASGHRVIIKETADGKLTVDMIDGLVKEFEDEHTVKPKMVYLSDTTELGTIYKKAELKAISDYCHSHGLYLYLDGARLGAALTCPSNDLSIKDIANMVDAFYIGGTKNGTLIGEALVFINTELDDEIRFTIKQNNNLLAKGFIIGIQFQELLKGGENSLWLELARKENEMAKKLNDGLVAKGYDFVAPSDTNQIYPIITLKQHEELSKKVLYEPFRAVGDDKISVRFCTGYYTTDEDIEQLLAML
ncbi:MAG: aminotransferase class I/II-fold pyridoxal phosphate-dependent enzyme [Clostridia bacterium]|nr:aminotransferase class I/II-fold pyridoxal phosphate-dependent enzyme [Clostridia bacterium]